MRRLFAIESWDRCEPRATRITRDANHEGRESMWGHHRFGPVHARTGMLVRVGTRPHESRRSFSDTLLSRLCTYVLMAV